MGWRVTRSANDLGRTREPSTGENRLQKTVKRDLRKYFPRCVVKHVPKPGLNVLSPYFSMAVHFLTEKIPEMGYVIAVEWVRLKRGFFQVTRAYVFTTPEGKSIGSACKG